MSAVIDFLTNASLGFPFSAQIANLMQTDYKRVEKAVAEAYGNSVIVEGMTWTGSTITPGCFTWNGELIYFDGTGTPVFGEIGFPNTIYIDIQSNTVDDQFCDGSGPWEVYTETFATFAINEATSDLQYGDLDSFTTLNQASTDIAALQASDVLQDALLAALNENPVGNEIEISDEGSIDANFTAGVNKTSVWKEPNGRVTIEGELAVNAISFAVAAADILVFTMTDADTVFAVPSGATRLYAEQCYYANSGDVVYGSLEAYMDKATREFRIEQRSIPAVLDGNAYVQGTLYFKISYFSNSNSL